MFFISVPHWPQSPSISSGALGSTHRHKEQSLQLHFHHLHLMYQTPHAGQLVNVNGGEIKILGQKMVTYVPPTRVVMNITFLIVEDVVNLIIGS